jgi:hypothetical protein
MRISPSPIRGHDENPQCIGTRPAEAGNVLAFAKFPSGIVVSSTHRFRDKVSLMPSGASKSLSGSMLDNGGASMEMRREPNKSVRRSLASRMPENNSLSQ